MYPELLHLGDITIYSYGACILSGAILGFVYMSKAARAELNATQDHVVNLALLIIVAAVVGGKVLYYLESPARYINDPSRMLDSFSQGFVFYGSLLFAVPTVIWFYRKRKWPIWQALDLTAITAMIIHLFGRLGCFMAGCCHGVPTDSIFGITFTSPACEARPLNTPLHPTQLYESGYILIILIALWLIKKRKQFHGQVALIYVVLYAVGRSVIEEFRGDEARGYVFDGWLSHSQFISLLLLVAIAGLYAVRLRTIKKNPQA